MDNYLNNINIQDIVGSIQVLDNLVSSLSTIDLNSSFLELEDYIKNTNFEHGNCIMDYKDDLVGIMNEIKQVKMKISHLTEAMGETCDKFQNKEELNNQDLGEISSLYNGSINNVNVSNNGTTSLIHNSNGAVQLRNAVSSTKVLEGSAVNNTEEGSGIYKIPPVENTNNGTTSTVNQSQEINTVPIGLGIAATGITASVGAVIVDGMKSNDRVKLSEYKEDNDTSSNSQSSSGYYSFGKEVLESNDQYQASRNKKLMDKFYGENNEYYEDED